jgi:predicted nuclease of restriction endonuclease-like (RecB) superfamily
VGHPRTRAKINSLLFERLALGRDEAGVMAPAHKGHEITRPSDLVKDPMVLEFTGLRRTSGSASRTWKRP